MKQNYDECLRRLLLDEGGNDDDPRDPGGRTSRGITQREWDRYGSIHPSLPKDVWQAPLEDIKAIYRKDYWDAQNCDELPSGLDYSVFDYGVNSGIRRSGRVLQRLLGITEDGIIGPVTVAEAKKHDPIVLVLNMNEERLRFLRSLKTFVTFGKGWTRRVEGVKNFSIELAKQPQPLEQGFKMPFPFNLLFSFVNPEKIGGWVRGFTAATLGAIVTMVSAKLPFLADLLPPSLIDSVATAAGIGVGGLITGFLSHKSKTPTATAVVEAAKS